MTAFTAWIVEEPDDLTFAPADFVEAWPALEFDAVKLTRQWSATLTIDGGAASTDDNDVTLALSALVDGAAPDQMCFSNDGATWSAWESYATTKAWQLPAQDDEDPHTCTVHVRFRTV